nr:hypothetical protein [Tanacetum cinerariifolium]
MIFDGMVRNVNTTKTPTLRQYSRRATRIAQSKSLSPATDEPVSLLRDNSQGEAFLTVSSLDAGQDRENINKTSALPYESSPRVTSLDVDEGSMQQKLQKLMDLCTGLQRQQTQMAAKIKDQDLEISGLKVRVKILEDKDRGREEPAQEDTPIKRGNKGKEKVVESDVPKKKKLQEQIDAQVAREMEKEFIDEQVAADLFIGEKIELINELVKYQDHHAKILKYQAQQRKPLSKKEQREFYMSVPRSHAGWKTRHFRGMTLEEIKEKFILVWKQIEDFMDIDYWKIIRLGGHTAVYQFSMDMLKQFDREDLYQLWILVKETITIKQATKDKEKELWVELKRPFEPNFED